MLVETDSFTERITIYVRLLNEGTEVFRPVKANRLDCGAYRLDAPDDYAGLDEEWEFSPGSVVECEEAIKEEKQVLVAKRSIQLDNQGLGGLRGT